MREFRVAGLAATWSPSSSPRNAVICISNAMHMGDVSRDFSQVSAHSSVWIGQESKSAEIGPSMKISPVQTFHSQLGAWRSEFRPL